MFIRSIFLLLVAVILSLSANPPASAAPGDPDLTFGPGTLGGSIATPSGPPPGACVVQADGKILVTGVAFTNAYDLVVARYLPHGFLDTGFGNRGVAAALEPSLDAVAICLQADEKILVLASAASGSGLSLVRFTAEGQLDPSFGNGGKLLYQVPNVTAYVPVALDLQPSGKIVILGNSPAGPVMHCFLPDGSPESSFGNGGAVFVTFAESGQGEVVSLRCLSDGRLLVVGRHAADLAVAQFNVDGSPDPTFATGAKLPESRAETLTLLPNGRFLVGGSFEDGSQDALLACFEANGSLDSTFGSGGTVRLIQRDTSGFSGGSISDIALTSSGSIVVKGFQLHSYLARFQSNGALDESFAEKGIETSVHGLQRGRGLRVLPDDSILVAGTPGGGFGLTKVAPSGGLDRSFAGGARVVEDLDGQFPGESTVKVLPDGRIYSCTTLMLANSEHQILRYLPNGALDSTFASAGRSVIPATGSISFGDAGEIYLGSSTGSSAADGFSVRRLLENGSPDLTFGKSGEARAIFPQGPSYVRSLLIGANETIVAIGHCENGGKLGIARFRSNGQLDTTFSADGKLVVPAFAPYAEFACALQNDGKILLARIDGHRIVLNRWNVNGTLDTSFGNLGSSISEFAGLRRVILRAAPGGKIVLGTSDGGQRITILRFLSTGALDPTFGEQGRAATELSWTYLRDFEVERDGKIIVLCRWGLDLVRFTESGEADPSFGVGGRSVVELDGWSYGGAAIALGPTGKIVVCGGGQIPFPDRNVSLVTQIEGDTFSGPAKPQLSLAQISGEPVTGEASGTHYAGFRAGGVSPFAGSIQQSGVRLRVIFGSQGNILLRQGDTLPQIDSGARIVRFRDPQGGALVATLQSGKAGVSHGNAEVLLTGLNHGKLEVAARAGMPMPGLPEGTTIRKFLAVAQDAEQAVFLVTLAGSGVTAMNRVALCVASNPGEIRVLARTGSPWNGRAIRTLTTLVPAPGSRAHNRWRAGNSILARISFINGGEAVVRIPFDATGTADWVMMFQSGPNHGIPDLAGATLQRFRFADLARDGTAVVRATLIQDGKRSTAILRNSQGTQTVLARTDDSVPTNAKEVGGLNLTVRDLGDPLIGAEDQIAFLLTLGNGAKAIGSAAGGTGWTLLANTGANAPGGGAWSAFDSLVLPKEGTQGPVFTGRLINDPVARVNSTNHRGIWALTSWFTLERLLRTGDSSHGSTIRSFAALNPNTAHATGFGIEATVTALARLSDGRQVRLEIVIP